MWPPFCGRGGGAEMIEGGESSFSELTSLNKKKKQPGVDDYSRTVSELSPNPLL